MQAHTMIPTRRALLGVLATASAFAGVTALSLVPAHAAAPPAWNRCLRKVERLRAACRGARSRYTEALARAEAGRPSLDCIHWDEFLFADRHYVSQHLDVEAEWAHFQSASVELDADVAKQAGTRFRKALDSVTDYRAAEERNEKAAGFTKARYRAANLETRLHDAECELVRMPAPDTEALRRKVELMFGPTGRDASTRAPAHWCDESLDAIIADANRLLGARAA